MLFLEKATSAQLWQYLHKRTRKCFAVSSYFSDYIDLGLPRAPMRTETLQASELSFANRDLVHFFGVRAVPFRDHEEYFSDAFGMWKKAAVLGDLPLLKHLYLRFRAPMTDSFNDSWLNTGHLRESYVLPNDSDKYPPACGWRGGHSCRTYHVSCQSIVIDWILTYAVDCINHIPNVTLYGWNKDDIRN